MIIPASGRRYGSTAAAQFLLFSVANPSSISSALLSTHFVPIYIYRKERETMVGTIDIEMKSPSREYKLRFFLTESKNKERKFIGND